MKEINLVVDVGNTRIKYAFFEGNVLKETGSGADLLFENTRKWKTGGYMLHLFLSGSGQWEEEQSRSLKKMADTVVMASPSMDLPLKIGYSTPSTLGFDRIAICTGAMTLFPGRSLLVIDTGTAITFNYVSEEGVFLGGNISPGLEMRFRSLHQYTARLPYVLAGEYGGIGDSTESAIRNGVMNGMLFEIMHYIRDFKEKNREGKVVITGGNSCYLEKFLYAEAEFAACLGLIGLNEILIFTKKFN